MGYYKRDTDGTYSYHIGGMELTNVPERQARVGIGGMYRHIQAFIRRGDMRRNEPQSEPIKIHDYTHMIDMGYGNLVFPE